MLELKFNVMKKVNLFHQILLVIISTQLLLTSCSNYYEAINTPLKANIDKVVKIDSLNKAHRNFILRNDSNAFSINNLVIDTNKNLIECTLETLPSFSSLYLRKEKKSKMKYKKTPFDLSVLNEVHVFITPDTSATTGKYNLLLDKVQRIEIIEKDKKRTTGSYVLGGLIITAVVILITAAMAGISSTLFTFHPF
jgi:hypothetical protein